MDAPLVHQLSRQWHSWAAMCGLDTNDGAVSLGNESVSLAELLEIYENKLESVYNCNIENNEKTIALDTYLFSHPEN